MTEPVIQRRTLPSSLRYLAQKLDEPLGDAERAGVALTLRSLADEIDASEFPKPFELTVTFPGRFTTSDLPHGVEGCICRPWTRQGGEARFLEPGESVALVSGWERHPDCPNHRPPVIREGDPALNDLQDYLEGDRTTAQAAAKRLDQRAVTQGQLSPMTYYAQWGELPDLKGRP